MERRNENCLKRCMQRAEKGGEFTIGFFGGSITQGCAASVHERSYAYLVFRWWEKTFPKSKFHYVNGGIGGTTSHFGAARIVPDLLMYQPDVVVVDFSVNDTDNAFFQETYEGVVRKLLAWDSEPAVLLLNHVFYDTGVNAQEIHNAIGDRYGIPHVSIKDSLYRRMKAGEYTRGELTGDGLHPNDRGHKLVAEEICGFLEEIRMRPERTEEIVRRETSESQISMQTRLPGSLPCGNQALPAPMTANTYEDAKRLTIREISPELMGFRADAEEKQGHLDVFKNGWIGGKAGDKIRFEVTASCIAVQYRKTISRPALRARVILDENREDARILDGNFDEDWGDCLYLEPILHHGDRIKHHVEIEIIEGKVETAAPFYLLSLIVA